MIIRSARREDLAEAMRVIECGRRYMRACGNDVQWVNGYPTEEQILKEIDEGKFFVWEEACGKAELCPKAKFSLGKIHGVFSFILDPDPTYDYVEGGKWLNDEPYGTIHRMASDGSRKGFFGEALEFCKARVDNIRMDTHEVNSHMRRLAEASGFRECGVIYVADGTPRVAYQLVVREDGCAGRDNLLFK